jgi:tetratricopeptide (TPR) repeat protein
MKITIQQAITTHQEGKLEEAEQLYRSLLETDPTNLDANNNLGVLLFNLERFDEAEKYYRKAIEFKADYAEAHNNLGVVLQALKRFDEAEISFNKAIEHKTNYAEAYYNLGNLLSDLKRLDEAEASFNKAIKLKSDHVETHFKLGNILRDLKRFDDAEKSYRKAIEIKPDYFAAYNNLGVILDELGRFDDAVIIYKKTLELKPDHVYGFFNLGNTLYKLGKFDECEINFSKAIKHKPNFAEAYFNLGNTLEKLGKLEEAVSNYKKTIEFKPDYADAYFNLGNVYNNLKKFEEAEASYKKAIEIKPVHGNAHNNLGALQESLGKFVEAEINYKKAIEFKPEYAEAYFNLSNTKKIDNDTDYLDQLYKLSLHQNLSEEERCYIYFSLAKSYKDLNKLSNSFEYYSKANPIKKKLLNYDISKDIKLFENLKKSHSDIKKNSLVIDVEFNKPRIIFIIGMPRSGTTLTEQIISSHSKVTAGGELSYIYQFGNNIAQGKSEINEETLLDFRKHYLEKLEKISNGNLMVTDKMTFNFKYIGLICSAFPEAKIIHVKRDSAAICWGNYEKCFSSMHEGYSYDLDDLTTYYKLYKNIIQFWEKQYRDRIYNLNYETLTINQEEETRKLIQYLDLEWENECLAPQDNKRRVNTASNWQVRQKVYKDSSKQWKKFEPFLKGAFDHLDD